MKKSLIAVAALAAVGAASAQSSVTLYGIVDTNYGVNQVKTTTFDGTVTTTTKVRATGLNQGHNLSGSRWGLKGQEDLGNGLSAVFNVEAGFDSANGAFAGGFNRRSVVGLKGGFGQVLLGRDYTPMDSLSSDYQAIDVVTGDDLYGSLVTGRYNGVHYSGEFGGVGIKAFAGYDDSKTKETVSSATSIDVNVDRTRSEGYGVGVSYAGGPFTVGAAVQQFRTKTTISPATAATLLVPAGTTTDKHIEYGVGATYDLTAAKLYAHYLANDTKGAKPVQQFGFGVTAPFGAFTLGAQYAYNYHKEDVGIKAKGHDFGLQGTYALSKRTAVYARAVRANSWKIKSSGVTTKKTHTDSFGVGIRHRF